MENTARPAFWPMGGAWLSAHLWEHYLFTGDREFLATEAYPAIKGAAEFCSDWLVEDGHGRLVTAASCSPEIDFHYDDAAGEKKAAGISMGPTMDWRLCARSSPTASARANPDRDPELRAELKLSSRNCFPSNRPRGSCRSARGRHRNRHDHRHISHLYALHQQSDHAARHAQTVSRPRDARSNFAVMR